MKLNNFDWYWYPKEDHFLFAFRTEEAAKAFSTNDAEKITDMSGCDWFMVQIQDIAPTKYIEQLCGLEVTAFKKPVPAKKPKKIDSNGTIIPATKGWETINSYSTFKKNFITKETKDTHGKEIHIAEEKGTDYRLAALNANSLDWEIRRTFESRTMRTLKNDGGKFVLLLPVTTDHTRIAKLANSEGIGSFTVLSGSLYGEPRESFAFIFSDEDDRSLLLNALRDWYI